MPDTEVRVGVADTGGWANSGHMAVYQQHPQATLVDVCDVDIQRAERAVQTFGAEFTTADFTQLVEHDDIDVVDIVTPNVAHAPVTLEVMKAGNHVICEKSLTMSSGQAQDMAQAAKDAGVKNGINFVYCCHPPTRYARHLIQLGHIRRISHVNIAYMQRFLIDPKVPWCGDCKRP